MTCPSAARTLLALLALLCLTACRSPYVETTIENTGAAPLRLIEVDYPSASFGLQSLDPHGAYHYHFKIQGTGPVTITFTDAAGKSHTVAGPILREGQQGTLHITIDPSNGVSWGLHLTGAK